MCHRKGTIIQVMREYMMVPMNSHFHHCAEGFVVVLYKLHVAAEGSVDNRAMKLYYTYVLLLAVPK